MDPDPEYAGGIIQYVLSCQGKFGDPQEELENRERNIWATLHDLDWDKQLKMDELKDRTYVGCLQV